MPALTLAQLTEKKLDGAGVFDVLVQSLKLHLETQYRDGRITGPEYAQVYLGQVNAAMETALAFLSAQQRIGLEADLLAKQILLAEKQLEIAQAQLLQTQAQTALIEKQGENMLSEKARIEAQTAQIEAETLNVPKQGLLLDQQVLLATQQVINSEVEKRLAEAKVCESQANFDLLVESKLKTAAETALLGQKMATEKAQILELGVQENSVIGRQRALYYAQAEGFKRDAEQKAAKLYVDVWSAMRMSDTESVGTTPDFGLAPASMAAVMTKLRGGIGA